MARAPRSTIPKTSGQGISRGIYQKARDIAGPAQIPGMKVAAATSSGRDQYAKVTPSDPGTMNVDYANTYDPRNLQEIQAGAKLGTPQRMPKALKPTIARTGPSASKVLK